ncbi:unnamed protein product [Linum trigynum]|uniref:Uncharacterized protein n=1 Tax=Linum trigynum TaxID=586398 RepID=A0AAV2DCS8_9ROSI
MENVNDVNGGEDNSRSGNSNQEEGERQRSHEVSMDVEEQESPGRLSVDEGDSLTKRELFRIIADQDRAIAALRRELEGERSEDMMMYSPGWRKRDRVGADSVSQQHGLPHQTE